MFIQKTELQKQKSLWRKASHARYTVFSVFAYFVRSGVET